MTEIRNIWEDYGFSRNPYHTEHLQPTEKDSQLYVHREQEEQELGQFIVSENAGAIIVEGNVGCGKTTFINQTQYNITEDNDLPRILPSVSLVEIVKDTGPRELVLSILTATLKALRQYSDNIESRKEFKELDRYTRKALIQNWSGGGNIFGVGASGGKKTTPTEPVDVPLQTLQDLLDSAATLARENSYEKIIILVNNLDHIEEDIIFDLLHDLRDTILDLEPYLFVMSGPVGLRQTLSTTRSHRRISEKIANNTVRLTALSKNQVNEVLRKRVNRYRSDPEVQAPVPESVINILYEVSNGEIRYILNRADSIARTVADKLIASEGIDEELAIAALKEIVREEVEALGLTDRKMEVLGQIVQAGEIQPKDYKKFDFNSTQAFTNYLTEFYDKKLLERTREGRNTIYTPRGDMRLYFDNPENE